MGSASSSPFQTHLDKDSSKGAGQEEGTAVLHVNEVG